MRSVVPTLLDAPAWHAPASPLHEAATSPHARLLALTDALVALLPELQPLARNDAGDAVGWLMAAAAKELS